MKIDFPTKFEVVYSSKNRRYYGETYKKDIIRILLKSSNDYCMYCGRKLILDNDYLLNLDHSVEKDGYAEVEKAKTPFKHCKYNFSVTCVRCNQKYKNKMIDRIPYDMVSKELNCSSKDCKEPCEDYLKAREEYIKRNKIILQPDGVKNDKGKYLGIQYDLLKQIFVPNICEGISNKDIDFIEEHIARFNMNRVTASSCIMEMCELIWRIIDIMPATCNINNVLYIAKEVRYDNIIAKVFLEFIEENIRSISVLKDFCELYMLLSYI